MKFIHTADIHLDSPLRGLTRYPGAPAEEIRGATREALKNLVKLAIDESVDFVIIAGDVYDGDWRDYNTGLFFVEQMLRLDRANIPVYLLKGNHDAKCQITKFLELPKNVHEFDTKKPNTFTIEPLKVALHGQGYHTQAVLENLAIAYPPPRDGYFNIGVLHTSATGREGHENYAPCGLADLLAKNYDYWALGHVHNREILNESPYIIFSGNLQGRHIRETGEKGCTIVSVDNGGTATITHHAVDVLRWAHWTIDLPTTADIDEAIEIIRLKSEEGIERLGVTKLAVRMTLTGACPAHAEINTMPDRFETQVRQVLLEAGHGALWLEKLRIKTRMVISLDLIEERTDFIGDLYRTCRNLAVDLEQQTGLLPYFSDLAGKIPSELKSGAEPLDPTRPDFILQILPEVQEELLTRLLISETPA